MTTVKKTPVQAGKDTADTTTKETPGQRQQQASPETQQMAITYEQDKAERRENTINRFTRITTKIEEQHRDILEKQHN